MDIPVSVLQEFVSENFRLWREDTKDSEKIGIKKNPRFTHIVNAHKIEAAYFIFVTTNKVKLLENGILKENALVHLCAKSLYDVYISFFLLNSHFPAFGFDAKEFQLFLKELVEERKILEIVEQNGKKYYLSAGKAKVYRLAQQHKRIFMPYLLKTKKKATKKPKLKTGLLF